MVLAADRNDNDLRGLNGAAREARTPDPLITNEVLYQLSYCGNATTERLPIYHAPRQSPVKAPRTRGGATPHMRPGRRQPKRRRRAGFSASLPGPGSSGAWATGKTTGATV